MTVGSKSRTGSDGSDRSPQQARRDDTGSDSQEAGLLEQARPTYDASKPGGVESRYLPVGEVGRGGWGIIERAVDRQLDREVAVKRFVHEDDVTEAERHRFFHEAKVTSQLQHPGIVPVHELGDQQGAYYVMKLLDGITLGEFITRHHAKRQKMGRMNRFQFGESLEPLLQRFVDVCQAVAYAHRRGVVHRDLKPANVMVSDFGETVVLDWGMAHSVNRDKQSVSVVQEATANSKNIGGAAKAVDATSTLTEPDGTIAGTPAFMSPEQAAGKISSINQASDIYALGVMLYNIVAGRHPYQGQSVEQILKQVRIASCPDLRSVESLAPAPLVSVVKKAMAAEPCQRYQSADQMVDDVRRFIAGDSISVHRESAIERGVRWCRHHQGIAASIAVSGSVLLIGAIVFGWVIQQSHRAEKLARMEAQRAHREAVLRLGEAREATDTWLIELSGSLEFYPGMESLRAELLDRAIEQYDQLLSEERAASALGFSLADANDLEHSETVSQRTAELAGLERIKALLRLGDLHRLTGDKDRAGGYYRDAQALASAQCSVGNTVSITPVSLPGNSAQTVSLGSIQQQFELERIQSMIGLLLLPVSELSPDELPANDEIEAARTWLSSVILAANLEPTTKKGETIDTWTARVASAYVRMELALHHRSNADGHSDAIERLEPLSDALGVARWLASHRDEVVDRRLSESVQTSFSVQLSQVGRHDLAVNAWTMLIEDLQTWLDSDSERIDYLQSLAHALLQRGNGWAAIHRSGDAITDYQASIDAMEKAWKLTDGDFFFRTNLATAQNNLGQLVSRGKHQDAGLASKLLVQALRTYEAMLREDVTQDRLRRYAQTHHALSTLVFDSDVPRPYEGLSAKRHAQKAVEAFEILGDYGPLTAEDQACLDESRRLLNSTLTD